MIYLHLPLFETFLEMFGGQVNVWVGVGGRMDIGGLKKL